MLILNLEIYELNYIRSCQARGVAKHNNIPDLIGKDIDRQPLMITKISG